MSFRLGLPFVCLLFAISLFDGVNHPFLLLLALLLHEAGHILTARLVGAPLLTFSAGLCGLSLSFDFSALSYPREMAVLLSGSGMGLFCALLSHLFRPESYYFPAVSASLAIVNLLPIRGLDGGEALHCLFRCFLLPDPACRIMKGISFLAAAAFWLATLWIALRIRPNLSLLAAATCLLFRCTKEG